MSKIKLIVVIGRSASGKDTLVKGIVKKFPNLHLIIHYTTRPKRNNETGEEYDMNTARTRFVKAADSMLTICGMRTINKEYDIDAILLACYGRKGIYQFAELLEML